MITKYFKQYIGIFVLAMLLMVAWPSLVWAEGPVINQVTVTFDKDIANNGTAKITWVTDTEADGRVDYGLTELYGNYSASSNAPSRYHEITIGGLQSEKTYHYKITSKSYAGGISVSFDQSFKTPKITNTIAPVVSEVHTSQTGGTYFIVTFLTNEPTDPILEYDVDQAFSKPHRVSGKRGQIHEILVKGLKQNTVYWYRLRVRDSDKNETVWGEQRVNTYSSVAEKESLTISQISPVGWPDPLIQETSIMFRWHTNQPAIGSIEYKPIGKGSKKVNEVGFYRLEHEYMIDGLLPGTGYYIKISARDIFGKTYTTTQFTIVTKPTTQTIITPPATTPVPPVPIIRCEAGFYGVSCRDKSVENTKGTELRNSLKNFWGVAPRLSDRDWQTLLRAYVYGDYPLSSIKKAIKFGGKTVHPSIPWSAWQNAKDYKDYIDR